MKSGCIHILERLKHHKKNVRHDFGSHAELIMKL